MDIFEVVQPEFEASLEIIRQSLMLFDVPLTEIYGFTDTIRQQNYSNLKIEKLHHSVLETIKRTPFLLEMSWLKVTNNSKLIGKSISELEIRSKTGVSIVGILRNNELIPNPDSYCIFEDGDYIAIIGLPESKKIFESMMI